VKVYIYTYCNLLFNVIREADIAVLLISPNRRNGIWVLNYFKAFFYLLIPMDLLVLKAKYCLIPVTCQIMHALLSSFQ